MKRITCLLALFYLAATHCTFGSPVITAAKSDSLRIVITFNNASAESNLKAAAGSDYLTLPEHPQKLNLDSMKVTDIFISHNQWNHVYGLRDNAGVKNFQVNTFIPKSSVEAIRQQVPRIQFTGIDE